MGGASKTKMTRRRKLAAVKRFDTSKIRKLRHPDANSKKTNEQLSRELNEALEQQVVAALIAVNSATDGTSGSGAIRVCDVEASARTST